MQVIANNAGFDRKRFQYTVELLFELLNLTVKPLYDEDAPEGLSLRGESLLTLQEIEQAFIAVSLKREIDTGTRDRHGRFDESAIRWEVKQPVVNILAAKLQEKMAALGMDVPTEGEGFKVILTHDIDRVTPLEPTSLLKGILKSAGIIRQKNTPPLSKILQPNLLIEAAERILEVEADYGARSWFLMLSGPFGLGRYSSRYDAKWKAARKTMELAKSRSAYIGLHGSYYASDRSLYRKEAERLARIAGLPIAAHRNHYLRFDPQTFWGNLETAGIEYDFSVGYSAHPGFRAGIANVHHPFDYKAERASRVLEIPMVYMDRNDHIDRREEILGELRAVFSQVKRYSGCVSVLLHPPRFVDDKRWVELYADMLSMIKEMGGNMDGMLSGLSILK